MSPLVSPPPGLLVAGSLPEVAHALAAHVAAERRRTWTTDARALDIDQHGRLFVEGAAPVPLEAEGLRVLLGHFGDRFPRGYGVLSQVSGRTLSEVWRELHQPEPGERVQVRSRSTGVWGVAPGTFPVYDVARFVADLSTVLPPLPTGLVYCTSPSKVELSLKLDGALGQVRVSLDDTYDGAGLTVRHWVDGVDRGDPLPSAKPPRRRASGDGAPSTTLVDTVVLKIRSLEKA